MDRGNGSAQKITALLEAAHREALALEGMPGSVAYRKEDLDHASTQRLSMIEKYKKLSKNLGVELVESTS